MPSGVLAVRTDPPRIGRYELLQRLGDPHGEPQYLARISGETRNGQLFVVRVVASEEPEHLAQALASRIKAVASLRHQNVLGLLDAGTTDDEGAYLVTRYVEGCPLAELQRRAPEMPARIVLALAVDALHGLHALHATGDLVHGNISPAALFVGTDGMCRIAELGDAELRAGATGYRSPEQIGGEQVDRRTDLFALGAVLWNALTGKTLYESDADVRDREPPRPSGVGLRPPAILDPLVLRSLARDPERRFATADDMARTLRDLATRTACLAARTEIADWIASVCQDELDARRRSIRDLALPPAPPSSQPLPTLPAVLPPARRSRRTPIIVAAAFVLAFAAVAWRWVATAPTRVAVAPALEITVLDVTALADPSPLPVAPPAVTEPPPNKPVEPATTTASVTKVKPGRVKPLVPKRPAVVTPTATVPVPPAETPVPKKPEPKAPPMENNPYVYK